MSKVCIIPARAGSKRIKNKNTKNFLDKPLIEWTLEAAIKSEAFKKIYISTDDYSIEKKLSTKEGFEILYRDGYSDDITTVQEACIKSLKQIEKQNKESYTTVVQLLATCPLRTDKDIINAIEFYNNKRLKFLVSSNEYTQNPYWAFKNDNTPLFFDALSKRSQDLPVLKCPNGAIWIANIKKLKKTKTFYTQDTHLYNIDIDHSIDIDTMADFKRAEMIGTYLLKQQKKKDINDILLTFPALIAKIKLDTKDIKDLETEDNKDTFHKAKDPNEWNSEIDDEVRKKQRIATKKRILQRNMMIYKKIKIALEVLKKYKYNQIIEMFYFKNLSVKEISESLGVCTKTVLSEKVKMLKILEKLME